MLILILYCMIYSHQKFVWLQHMKKKENDAFYKRDTTPKTPIADRPIITDGQKGQLVILFSSHYARRVSFWHGN